MRETTTPAGESAATEAFAARIRDAGLKVTSGRVAALNYLERHPHSSAASIHAALAEQHPSLSLQSVHNIVHDFTSHGILRRIDLPDADSALYETRAHDNHHHAQCIICHRVEDIDCALGTPPCMLPGHEHGMRIVEAAIVFRGICRACEARLGSAEANRIASLSPSQVSTT